MLELRPACENCQRALPPNALDARICSFECTFCADCVERVLADVCPNCGGGFSPRPVRPAHNWNHDNCLARYPATTRAPHKPVDPAKHAELRARIAALPPEQR